MSTELAGQAEQSLDREWLHEGPLAHGDADFSAGSADVFVNG